MSPGNPSLPLIKIECHLVSPVSSSLTWFPQFPHLVSPVPAAVNQLLLAQADQLPLRPGDWFKLMIIWILFSSHSSDINTTIQDHPEVKSLLTNSEKAKQQSLSQIILNCQETGFALLDT